MNLLAGAISTEPPQPHKKIFYQTINKPKQKAFLAVYMGRMGIDFLITWQTAA
jgi:hypothetical protein